jgi:hypothetical protein
MAAEDRIHGKSGSVKMDPTGVGTATAVAVASLDKWDLDMKKDKVKVTSFGDTNQVYVDGLPDLSGNYSGFYDPEDGLVIFDVIFGTVKPYLELIPSTLAATVFFGGKALMDGKISVDANGAVTIGGSFVAAGPWVIPSAA